MLCDVCSNIDVDELIPAPAILETGILSGARHHSSYQDLVNAAKDGCKLCKTIEDISKKLVKQPTKLSRMHKLPVQLKMRLQGHANPEYQGGSMLWVTCGGGIIANFEVYILRGTTTLLIRDSGVTYSRVRTYAF